MRPIALSFYLTASLLLGSHVATADTGGQFAAPGVRAPDDPNVNGFRFTLLYGENEKMSGLDVGLLSISESKVLSGCALVFGINKVTQAMDGGAAFALVNIHTGNDRGLNAAFVNKVNNADSAVDFGFINIADGNTMLDIGGVNITKSSTAQLGFINVTKKINGFQLGFINIAENGFLPVFPFFNFAVDEGD